MHSMLQKICHSSSQLIETLNFKLKFVQNLVHQQNVEESTPGQQRGGQAEFLSCISYWACQAKC